MGEKEKNNVIRKVWNKSSLHHCNKRVDDSFHPRIKSRKKFFDCNLIAEISHDQSIRFGW